MIIELYISSSLFYVHNMLYTLIRPKKQRAALSSNWCDNMISCHLPHLDCQCPFQKLFTHMQKKCYDLFCESKNKSIPVNDELLSEHNIPKSFS